MLGENGESVLVSAEKVKKGRKGEEGRLGEEVLVDWRESFLQKINSKRVQIVWRLLETSLYCLQACVCSVGRGGRFLSGSGRKVW